MKNKEAKSIFSSLENFSSIPPPELWDKIEAQLDQPKKKKRAIIWWSIAASLVVGLSVPAILYFNANPENGLEINVGNNANEVVLQKDSNLKSKTAQDGNKDQNDNNNLNDRGIKNNDLNKNQVVITTVSGIFSKAKDSTKLNNLNLWRRKGKIQRTNNETQSNAIVSSENFTSAMVKTESQNDKSAQGGNSNLNKNTIVSNKNRAISEVNKDRGIAENTISKSEIVISKSVQVNQTNANSKSIVSNQSNDLSGLKSDKEIKEKISSKDSLDKIKMEVAQLEKALAQLDKDKPKEDVVLEQNNKWSLQVFAGVMSSQNYNNQKALGNTVESKQSNGYGVKTNYKLNKKWGVSSGFKINELGQKIAGVSYYEQQTYSGMVSGALPLTNAIYQPSASKSDYQVVFISNNQDYMFASSSNGDNGFEKGNVTQNLKYFEMPLEISYALLSKKKTNITMNTGGFVGKLISNDIALNGNSIGENNNVNQYVYGTLLSSTLQYEFYKKIKFFVEPGMNYYINPLENQSFNQFQWMFNVGLNVSF